MTADSGRYSNLQVGNLKTADGTFVMNAGWVDGGGSYSDKLIIDETSAAGSNSIKIISDGGLEDAARNNTVFVKGADASTKFVVDGQTFCKSNLCSSTAVNTIHPCPTVTVMRSYRDLHIVCKIQFTASLGINTVHNSLIIIAAYINIRLA